MHPLRFLHIPKTAGTTVTESLLAMNMRNYFWRNYFEFKGDLETDSRSYTNLPEAKRRSLLLATGHAPINTGMRSVDELPTFTFLRDPIARTKSHCQHLLEGKSPEFWDELGESDLDLDALLERDVPQLTNLQTRYLLGSGNLHLPEKDADELVALALDSLISKLTCFGIVEEFNRSMIVLTHAMGWKTLPIYRVRNRSSETRRVHFEDRHMEKLRSMNELDIRLYGQAVPVFRERCGELGEALASDLARFEQQLGKRHLRFDLIDMGRSVKRVFQRP